MPDNFWLTATITAAAVAICTWLHFESLKYLNTRLSLADPPHRWRVVVLILSLLTLHITEIWIFGVAYYVLLAIGNTGELLNIDTASLFDTAYYSATVFTTLGFGDIVPKGAIRFLTGTEAIAGLTFITWSASYTVLAMQKTWGFTRD